jgi:hypothetical protein
MYPGDLCRSLHLHCKSVYQFFFFFFKSEFLSRARPTRNRGGHVSIYVLCLGFLVFINRRFWYKCELVNSTQGKVWTR